MRQHLSGIQGPPGPPGASVSVEDVASRVIAYIQRELRSTLLCSCFSVDQPLTVTFVLN